MHEGRGNAPVSVPQYCFWKLLGILKIRLLGGIFEPKLSMFSKNDFLLPQGTYFVIASQAVKPNILLYVDDSDLMHEHKYIAEIENKT